MGEVSTLRALLLQEDHRCITMSMWLAAMNRCLYAKN